LGATQVNIFSIFPEKYIFLGAAIVYLVLPV